MNKAEALKILDEAQRILVEKGWTQGYFAKNAAGENVRLDSEEAKSFCVLGAAFLAAGCRNESFIRAALIAAAPAGEPAEYNDAPGRTKEEVLALIDKAKEWVNEQGE